MRHRRLIDREAGCSYQAGVAVEDASVAERPGFVVDAGDASDPSARVETPACGQEHGEVIVGHGVEVFDREAARRTIRPTARDLPCGAGAGLVAPDVGDAVRQAVERACDQDGEERGGVE